MKRLASIICFVYSFVYITLMTSSDDVTGANDVFLSIVIGLVFGGFGYWFWPKKRNSLIQFGYSINLLDNPEELEYLKSQMPIKPKFKLWIGDKFVFAFNNPILMNEKVGVAKLKQFNRKELKLIEKQKAFTYHSFDDKGIWFELKTHPNSKKMKRKPYPFR